MLRGALVVAVMLPAYALAAPKCQAELAQAPKTLAATEVDQRALVAIALVVEICKAELPPALQRSLASLGYADPSARTRVLGNASNAEEARADFEAACPAWSSSALAKEFPGDKPLTTKVFETCEFAKHEVMTAEEFAKADVRFATTAVVLFDALKRIGVDKKLARQLTRVIVLPLEAGRAPPKEDPAKAKAKMKALMKGDFTE